MRLSGQSPRYCAAISSNPNTAKSSCLSSSCAVSKESALAARRKAAQEPDLLRFLRAGKFHGFRPSGLSAYDNVDPHTVVRELVQNALDAAKERDVTRVVFKLEDVPVKSIPGLAQYSEHLLAAIETQRKKGALEQAQSIVAAMRSSIEAKTVPVLWVRDNGIGLNKDGMERLLGDGQSAKADESTAGSYGNGHMTSFPASDLRYILYGGVHGQRRRTVSGHTILATHAFGNEACGEDGYLARKIRENDLFNRFDFYAGSRMPLLKNQMDWVEQEFGSGSVVGILGFNRFNRFKSDNDVFDVIEDAVATHFSPTIHDEGMEVMLSAGDLEQRVIDSDALERILERRKSRLRRGRNSIGPSGGQAWETLQTLRNEPERSIDTTAGKVRFYYRELPRDSSGGTHLQLFRNGMWITNAIPRNRASDFSSVVPFNGVILLQPSDAKEACRLVCAFEGPRHIDVDLTRKSRNSPDRRTLERFFDELRRGILDLVPELETEEHDPGFFSLEVMGEGVRNNPRATASGAGTPERVPRRHPPNIRHGKGKRKKKRGTLRRQGRRIEAQITAVRSARGIRVRAKMREDAQNAELRVVLANGSDETCDAPEPDQYLAIGEGATVGGRPVKAYVTDRDGTRRAVLLGPVFANGDEIDVWLPNRTVQRGGMRVELVSRSAVR